MYHWSVTSQGTVTRTPSFLLKFPVFGFKAQFNWMQLARSSETLNPISNLSLPCNPQAVDLSHWIWLVYLSTLSPEASFFSKGRVTLCPLITRVAKIWFIFLGWHYISFKERRLSRWIHSAPKAVKHWGTIREEIHVTVKSRAYHSLVRFSVGVLSLQGSNTIYSFPHLSTLTVFVSRNV